MATPGRPVPRDIRPRASTFTDLCLLLLLVLVLALAWRGLPEHRVMPSFEDLARAAVLRQLAERAEAPARETTALH